MRPHRRRNASLPPLRAWDQMEDPRWGETAYRLRQEDLTYSLLPERSRYHAVVRRGGKDMAIGEEGREQPAGYFGLYDSVRDAYRAIERHYGSTRRNPASVDVAATRPRKDIIGQGTLYQLSTSLGTIYFMRYRNVQPSHRGIVGRFLTRSPGGDLTNVDPPAKLVREIEDALLGQGVDLKTPAN